MLFVLGTATYAQVGIGTATPNKSAMLDITSSNKGVLISRIALTGINDASTIPVTGLETGMLIYNTATTGTVPDDVTPGFYFWNGTAWEKVGKDAENGLSDDGSKIKLGGLLSEPLTTITADGTNATVADRKLLAITGLATADIDTQTNLMVVTDGTTGELRTTSISSPFSVQNISADLTLLASMETILVDATSAAVTVTLPDATTVEGKKYYIKKVDTSSNLVKIVAAAGNVEGQAPATGIYGGVYLQTWLLQSDGANWHVIK
jgi:hypothetical protein